MDPLCHCIPLPAWRLPNRPAMLSTETIRVTPYDSSTLPIDSTSPRPHALHRDAVGGGRDSKFATWSQKASRVTSLNTIAGCPQLRRRGLGNVDAYLPSRGAGSMTNSPRAYLQAHILLIESPFVPVYRYSAHEAPAGQNALTSTSKAGVVRCSRPPGGARRDWRASTSGRSDRRCRRLGLRSGRGSPRPRRSRWRSTRRYCCSPMSQ